MITVVVLINGQPIFTRSARNIGPEQLDHPWMCRYKVDSGQTLYHDRDTGFVPLVKQMLDTVDENNISFSEDDHAE